MIKKPSIAANIFNDHFYRIYTGQLVIQPNQGQTYMLIGSNN